MSWVTILNEILTLEVKLDPSLKRENNAILKQFLDTFIPKMKNEDKLFSLLYQDKHYTGSYFSDLRVKNPDEYDVNLVLKLPFKEVNVEEFKELRKLFFKHIYGRKGFNPKQRKLQKKKKISNSQGLGIKKNDHQYKDHCSQSLNNKNMEAMVQPKKLNARKRYYKKQNARFNIPSSKNNYDDTSVASKTEKFFDVGQMDSTFRNQSGKYRKKRKNENVHCAKNIPGTSKNNLTSNIKIEASHSKQSNVCNQQLNDSSKSLTKDGSFKRSVYCVKYHRQVPSYAKYHTFDGNNILRDDQGLAKLFKERYFIPKEVLRWMESVVCRTLEKYRPYPDKVINITPKKSGPAIKIVLEKRDGIIDIDLVPAIEHTVKCKPPGMDPRVCEKVEEHFKCFLVPKLYQPIKKPPVSKAEQDRLWRTHYPEVEDKLIHDLGCVKPVIKLLKLLRDKHDWKILASYYLKTIVLWMVLENCEVDHWKMNCIGERFLEAVKKLAECVDHKEICYFFSSPYNLLEKLSAKQASNICGKLRKIITAIQKDDQELYTAFKCSPPSDD